MKVFRFNRNITLVNEELDYIISTTPELRNCDLKSFQNCNKSSIVASPSISHHLYFRVWEKQVAMDLQASGLTHYLHKASLIIKTNKTKDKSGRFSTWHARNLDGYCGFVNISTFPLVIEFLHDHFIESHPLKTWVEKPSHLRASVMLSINPGDGVYFPAKMYSRFFCDAIPEEKYLQAIYFYAGEDNIDPLLEEKLQLQIAINFPGDNYPEPFITVDAIEWMFKKEQDPRLKTPPAKRKTILEKFTDEHLQKKRKYKNKNCPDTDERGVLTPYPRNYTATHPRYSELELLIYLYNPSTEVTTSVHCLQTGEVDFTSTSTQTTQATSETGSDGDIFRKERISLRTGTLFESIVTRYSRSGTDSTFEQIPDFPL